MNFRLSLPFESKAKKLCMKNPRLRSALAKQFKLFQNNPHHPSLKLHRLKGKRTSQYAIWIQGDLRALSVEVDGVFVFFDLVTHDQY